MFAGWWSSPFSTIFSYATPLMDGVDGCSRFRQLDCNYAAAIALRSLLVDGVWKGVGSVIVFLPQVLLLFLFIGILEDSGYLARAALIADRTMAQGRAAGQIVHPAALGLRLRGAGHSCRRAPSKTSATASPPS
jgi:ferrous iron transport protein B